MAYATQNSAVGTHSGQWLRDFGAKLAERYTQYVNCRKTEAELFKLSDRELNDLGISRSMIRTIAHTSAYGE
ncbi:MAG: DUF1127 domain-containing protein [Rhodobacteraceae bacterium]|nr:DUF1127 domain-containing protein [Paracoccaceae bacterium]